MTLVHDISDAEIEFARKYDQGTVVESTITQIIPPTQIITSFHDVGFTGRLSVFDMSFCVPEGREKFIKCKVGDRITCIVLDVDLKNKQVKLGQRVSLKFYTELGNREWNVSSLATPHWESVSINSL